MYVYTMRNNDKIRKAAKAGSVFPRYGRGSRSKPMMAEKSLTLREEDVPSIRIGENPSANAKGAATKAVIALVSPLRARIIFRKDHIKRVRPSKKGSILIALKLF